MQQQCTWQAASIGCGTWALQRRDEDITRESAERIQYLMSGIQYLMSLQYPCRRHVVEGSSGCFRSVYMNRSSGAAHILYFGSSAGHQQQSIATQGRNNAVSKLMQMDGASATSLFARIGCA